MYDSIFMSSLALSYYVIEDSKFWRFNFSRFTMFHFLKSFPFFTSRILQTGKNYIVNIIYILVENINYIFFNTGISIPWVYPLST